MNRKSARRAIMVFATSMGLVITTTPAEAVVTRLTEGSWFVGKGDIQSAFGWDAKTTDANFENIVFTYEKVRTVTFDCIYQDKNVKTLMGTETETFSTTKAATYSTRISKGTTSVTGYNVHQYATLDVTSGNVQCDNDAYKVDNSNKVTSLTENLYASVSISVTSRKVTTTSTTKVNIWTASIDPFNP